MFKRILPILDFLRNDISTTKQLFRSKKSLFSLEVAMATTAFKQILLVPKYLFFVTKSHFTRSLLVFLLLLTISVSVVRAATLEVTSIGGTSTAGSTFSTWTHTANNPEFEGTAGAGAEVILQFDDSSNTVIADAAGAWSYTPTLLTEGQYDVNISSDGEVVKFTLTISDGSTVSDSSASGTASDSTALTTKGGVDLPEELPQTGAFDHLLVLISSGLLMIGLAMVSRSKFADILEDFKN